MQETRRDTRPRTVVDRIVDASIDEMEGAHVGKSAYMGAQIDVLEGRNWPAILSGSRRKEDAKALSLLHRVAPGLFRRLAQDHVLINSPIADRGHEIAMGIARQQEKEGGSLLDKLFKTKKD